MIDADNPVVTLCVQAMAAEAAGRPEDAARLIEEAWAARHDDFDACIAAHYLARYRSNDTDLLFWNLEAVRYADAVGDERVKAFYPSLYLNLGHAYEQAGDPTEARNWYQRADSSLGPVGADAYRVALKGGVARGLARVAGGAAPLNV